MRMMGEANELDYFGDLLFNTCNRDWRLADARCIPKLQAVQQSYDADPRRREEYLPRRMGALQWDAHAVVVSNTEATARGVGVMAYKNKEDKVANDKAYNKANKERIKVKSKAWYEANKESKREASKVWNEANKERALEISRSWKAVNKEKVKAHYRSWGKANPDKINAKSSRRRAHKLNLIPKHLKKCPLEKQRVIAIYKLCLLISKATGVQHHVDHMWPSKDGGPEWSGNMQIITAQENFSKGAKVCPELKRNIRQSLMEITNDI